MIMLTNVARLGDQGEHVQVVIRTWMRYITLLLTKLVSGHLWPHDGMSLSQLWATHQSSCRHLILCLWATLILTVQPSSSVLHGACQVTKNQVIEQEQEEQHDPGLKMPDELPPSNSGPVMNAVEDRSTMSTCATQQLRCDFLNCFTEIFIACPICLCVLCYDQRNYWKVCCEICCLGTIWMELIGSIC